ncbi:bifunctional 3-dehydroquinate dehydratase/shikimate dehydrogenase, chloroplastic-like [Solanum tuberosum]|uniref:bifunctional 3-dehydroquinate dehydratase/shikimate dehydrogenase, chloroplastic-like n=1 Tax=Solanum tuberosum TaxID=4113 RepID=UPI00073A3694|nr:PREDICTED: bifunctional 3-dehydroquinate dehydratase/shikimate dehydrogenase, chloroplastic-like [Solanum tuberosum]
MMNSGKGKFGGTCIINNNSVKSLTDSPPHSATITTSFREHKALIICSFKYKPEVMLLVEIALIQMSCTIPHKEDALDCCTEIDPTAKAIGVVNCIINRPDGKLFGCNTDYIGAISSIEEGLEGSQPSISAPPWLVKCLWSFVLVELERQLLMVQRKKRARVVIANHIYERAREIGDVVGAKALSLHDLSDFHPENDMILANTTSIGMQPKVDDTPISKYQGYMSCGIGGQSKIFKIISGL